MYEITNMNAWLFIQVIYFHLEYYLVSHLEHTTSPSGIREDGRPVATPYLGMALVFMGFGLFQVSERLKQL